MIREFLFYRSRPLSTSPGSGICAAREPRLPRTVHDVTSRVTSNFDCDRGREAAATKEVLKGACCYKNLTRRGSVLHHHKSLGYFAKYARRNSSITGGSVP